MGLDQYLHITMQDEGVESAYKRLLNRANERFAEGGYDFRYEYGESIHVSGYDFAPEVEQEVFRSITELTGLAEVVDPETPSLYLGPDHVKVVAAYWRKANAIHRWFVDNCQDGVDECQESDPISPEQLAKLVADCRTALGEPDKAGEVLPTQSGFFFGNTGYDEWYQRNLDYTRTRIEFITQWALMNLRGREYRFNYQSSW